MALTEEYRNWVQRNNIHVTRRAGVLEWKLLSLEATIPQYAHEGDSGFDFKSLEDMVLAPGMTYVFKIGLACAVPPGHEIQIRPRSGMSAKTPLVVKFGTVDSGYRGELGVIVMNCGRDAYMVMKGDRIAQGVICPVVRCEMLETDELPESQRAGNGFGSTGR